MFDNRQPGVQWNARLVLFPRLAMRGILMIALVLGAIGCSGQQQKDKFKDLDRPKPAQNRAINSALA